MIIETLTALLVLITAFYAWVTYRAMATNRESLSVMRLQTEALTRPYVSVGAFSEPNMSLFVLRIANTGETGADNVRLSMDRDFFQYGQTNRPSLREATVFQQPIEHLHPGAEIVFDLAQGFVVLGEKASPEITPPVFTITASYSYGGKEVVERTTIDLRAYDRSNAPRAAVPQEISKLRKKVEELIRKI